MLGLIETWISQGKKSNGNVWVCIVICHTRKTCGVAEVSSKILCSDSRQRKE